ncbi:MAG: recombinase family protein [Defluviitaleaceae bacterium]|nr:recombinase family protein [Defluviitaleaceae bacterium]
MKKENERFFGYVRCSTREQCPDRQIIALRRFGVPDENIVIEMMSGKNFQRPVYQELAVRLNPGDVFVIDSLDRLGRDRNAVIDEWRFITKERGADIVVLDMALLDTRKKDRDITAMLVTDLVLQILSYVSEKERLLNRDRQAAGIAAAKARGIKFGNQSKKRPASLGEICEKWRRNEITSRKAGRLLGVSHTTFLRWAKENKA